jgi:response regulator of citrate/malate metabolism
MNWAWDQKLSPTPKLILMALVDAANGFGVCWPSVSTVARKCCVSVHTVRRVMQELVGRRLLLTEQRYRKDGSCSSNRYRLQLEGGDRLSPAPDPSDR